MGRFTPIGFYDLSNLFAGYVGKHKRALVESPGGRHKGVRYLDLLRDRESSETLTAWPGAQALLQKIGTRLAALPQPAETINAHICAFDPGGFEAWGEDDAIDPAHIMRVHILLNPAPSFRIYSGAETMAPAPWHATVVSYAGQMSRSNFDAPNTAHELVLDLALDTGSAA